MEMDEPFTLKEVSEGHCLFAVDVFNTGDYREALRISFEALDIYPSKVIYSNIAACYSALKNHTEALYYMQMAIQWDFDRTFVQGYVRLLKAALMVGDVDECEDALELVEDRKIEVDLTKEKGKLWELKQLFWEISISKVRKEHKKVVKLCKKAGRIAGGCSKLQSIKAYALECLRQ